MDSKVEMLKSLGSDKQVVAYKVYQTLEATAIAYTAKDKGPARQEMAGFLAAELNAQDPGGKDNKGKDLPPTPRYSAGVRRQIAGLLAYIGGAAEVPALAEAMKDLDVREAARMALDRNPSDEATEALIAALNEIGPAFRVGVVGSLGIRAGEKVVKTLQSLVNDPDGEVRIAAAQAMGKTADASSDAVLITLSKQECRCTRNAAYKARLQLAENLARKGDKGAARKICQSVLHSEADEPQKKAADIALKSLG